MRDFTQGKLAADALRESESRLRVALEAAEMGTWLWRIPTDEQILDDSLRRLMGLRLDEEVATLDDFLKAVHPDDAASLEEALNHSFVTGERFTAEHLSVKRPGYGIPPKHVAELVGRTARRDLQADDVLTWEDVA
jgi:two-component system CheB/CheR fusion protein